MTGTKVKVRSLFLTALMVVSVFGGTIALSGSAVGAATNSHTLSDTNEGVTGVTYTHKIDAQEAPSTLNRVVADLAVTDSNPDHDLSSVTTSDITVMVDGEEYTGTYSSFSRDSASGEVRFTLDSAQTVDDNVTVIVGDVGNPSVSGDTQYTQETRLFEDTSGTAMESSQPSDTYTISNVAGGGGGDADPPYESDDYDATFDTGENRWNGQSLYFNANNFDSDNTYELHEVENVGGTDTVGQMVTEVGVDSSTQETLISTSNLDGEYVLTDGDGNVLQTDSTGTQEAQDDTSGIDNNDILTVVEQDFSASFADNSVGQGSDVSFSTDSNRANYDVLISSDGLSATELQNTFSGAAHDDGVVVSVDSNQDTISGTLPSDASTGNHTFDFTVVDTGASDSDYLDVSTAGPNAQFSQSVYTEMRGDPVTFTVDLQNVDSAMVRVGSPGVNYNTTLRVNDGDGDGEVAVNWNTWEAGKNSNEGVAFSAVDGDDSVTNVQRFSEDIPSGDRLSAAEYDLTASVDGSETDVAVVSLRERSTDSASQYVAPSAASYTNATELRGIMSESSEVAMNDQTITQVTASGLYGYLTASELESGGAHGVSLTVEQSGDQINQNPKQVSLDQSGVDVLMDETGNHVYLVVDSDTATAQRGNQAGLALKSGETYNATFVIDGDENPYVPEGETETVTTQFTIVDRTAEFDVNSDDEIIVSPASNQSITGSTSVAPGTEMSIRAKSTGESPFLKTDSVTVQDDGTFSGSFDFSNVSENTTFTATIPNQGFEDDVATTGRVGQPRSASVSISDQSSDGSTVTVDSVELSHGGFVTIHDSSLQDGATFDSVRGTSSYLDAGSHSNVEVSLDEPYSDDGTVIAMPHQDTNGNQAYDFVSSEGADDGPYTADGEAVTDSAELTIETPTPTPGTDTPGTDTPDTDTPDTPDTDSPTEEEQPGFGLIIALVAMAGAALLALRRSN